MPNTYFHANTLSKIQREILEEKYSSIDVASFVPLGDELGMGVESYVTRIASRVGQPTVLANGATDIGKTNVNMSEVRGRILPIAIAYSYTLLDLAKMSLSGQNLVLDQAVSARFFIERYMNNIVSGNNADGLLGLPNQTNVMTQVVAADGNSNGGTNSPLWIHKTGEQIYRDLALAGKRMRVLSNSTFYPTTLVLPQEQYEIIRETPYPSATHGMSTIYSYYLSTQQDSPTGVKEIKPLPQIKGKFSGGVNGIVGYTPRKDYLELVRGYDFTQEPPQQTQLGFDVYCHAAFGDVLVKQPASMIYITGI